MAPAVWNDDEFVSGGLKGITKFQGQLTEIEDDIEGKYGDQLALYFDECTVLESEEEVSLEGGKYTDWIKQTNKKNSVNQAFVGHITTLLDRARRWRPVPRRSQLGLWYEPYRYPRTEAISAYWATRYGHRSERRPGQTSPPLGA